MEFLRLLDVLVRRKHLVEVVGVDLGAASAGSPGRERPGRGRDDGKPAFFVDFDLPVGSGPVGGFVFVGLNLNPVQAVGTDPPDADPFHEFRVEITMGQRIAGVRRDHHAELIFFPVGLGAVEFRDHGEGIARFFTGIADRFCLKLVPAARHAGEFQIAGGGFAASDGLAVEVDHAVGGPAVCRKFTDDETDGFAGRIDRGVRRRSQFQCSENAAGQQDRREKSRFEHDDSFG